MAATMQLRPYQLEAADFLFRRARARPSAPVPALALPVLITSARMPAPPARCSRHTCTGAARDDVDDRGLERASGDIGNGDRGPHDRDVEADHLPDGQEPPIPFADFPHGFVLHNLAAFLPSLQRLVRAHINETAHSPGLQELGHV